MPNRSESVDRFMQTLDHPLKGDVECLRTLILAADPRITETVKWNAPTFGLDGNDRATFHLRAKKGLQLILHRGVKKSATELAFEDPSGLLKWLDKDRATIILENPDGYPSAAALVHRWIVATSEP